MRIGFIFALMFLICGAATTALADCPPQGDAKQALALELNPYKNRETTPTAANFNAQATLTAVYADGNDQTRWSREDAAVFEGTIVDVKPGGVETVNCHATAINDIDTHIEILPDGEASGSNPVIVEVTPRWRKTMAAQGVDWTTPTLHARLIGHRVRITGWLFDDLEHVRNAENTNPGGTQIWRRTVWEIHPITKIELISGGDQQLMTRASAMPLVAETEANESVHRSCNKGARWNRRLHQCKWIRGHSNQ